MSAQVFLTRINQRRPWHVTQERVWFHDQQSAWFEMALKWSNKQVVEMSTLAPELRKVRMWIGTEVRELPNAACQFVAGGSNPLKVYSTIIEGPGPDSRRQVHIR